MLPDTLGNLTNLQTLLINRNELTKLPKFLENLTNLEMLDISSTKIRTIPAWVGSLKQLKELDLKRLNLHSLPPDILDLDLPFNFSNGYILGKGTAPSTQPISLLHQLINLSDGFVVEKGIFFKNTTLSTQPISLFQQPRELIKAYFDSEKIPVHEAKVIFLGDGGAGKTHTICRIKNGCKRGEYNTQMTPGVEITSFQTESKDLTLNFWDFGGQEIMPSIHRCFLTQRALYVIVVSTRTGNITVQARHWLKTVDAFAPGAPVLIAVNCWENTVSRGVNNEMLYEEFPNLLDTVIFSAKCSSEQEFYQNLLRPIEEHAGKLDSCSMELPESWLHIEQALRDQTEHYIDGEKYLKICRDNGIEDEQIAQWLLEWFNDLGVCFSYSDGSGRPYQVLRPEWLTNAVYRILLDESGPDSDGTVRRRHIERSLASSGSGTLPDVTYNEKECSAILAVMKEFRLAYSTGEDERELFIPALCTQKMPDLSFLENFEQRVEYELQYAYLPDCVLHQLMIWYMENGVKPKYVWYRGLCVQVHTRWAEITGDFQHDKLCIRLYMEPDCPAPNCHDMLRDIYQEIQKINSRLALDAADSIVMHSDNQTAHFPLGPLLKAKQSGCEELTCLEDGEFHVYNIDKILDSVFEREQVQSALEQNRRNDLSKVNASAIYINCNIDSHDTYGWTAEDATKFYNVVSENHRLFTEEAMAKLIDALIEQNDAALKNLGKEMAADKAAKKSPLKRLKDFIGNAAKLGKDVQTLCQLAKAIGTAVPAFLEVLENLL